MEDWRSDGRLERSGSGLIDAWGNWFSVARWCEKGKD